MQSFVQYRRFRGAVEAQIQRDRLKIQGGQSKQGQGNPDLNTVDRDLEKGDTSDDAPHEDPPKEEIESSPTLDKTHDEDEIVDDEDDDDDNDHTNATTRGLSHTSNTLSRLSTQQTIGTALGAVLTGIQVRRRTTREDGGRHDPDTPHANVFVVGFEGPSDPNNPHNWSFTARMSCTFLIALIGFVVGFASSIDSSALRPAAAEFGVAPVVESMATGLFLIGFGAGALFAGPISETVGRNPVYIVTLALYMVFVMASALSPNIGAQLAFRFLAGFFGSTPLTCAGGSISDLWDPLERVYAFPIFANAAFSGPLMGPVVGGWIAQSKSVSWRWVNWVTLIFSGLTLVLVVLFQPETFAPMLLKWKAKHVRDLTGDDRYKAEIEIREQPFVQRVGTALYRPFLLTFQEPIIILIALYLTVIYIVLFTFLDGYDFIFGQIHGVSPGIQGTCFLGIIVGLFCATALVPLIYSWAKKDLAKIKEAGGDSLPPEFRLWYSMLGGAIALPVSLYWLGWTSYPEISIWSPIVASVFFGYGTLCVFITAYQYIIDSYEVYAASALASVTVIRYMAAGGMTIVGIPMYQNLGVHYTMTILASLSAILVPVPYIFYRYGAWIRSKSKYAIKTGSSKPGESESKTKGKGEES